MTTPIQPPPQKVPDSLGEIQFFQGLLRAVYLIFSRVRQIDPSPNQWTSGEGTPEGSVNGVVGDLYTRSDGGSGTSLYVKESGSGNTGWVGK